MKTIGIFTTKGGSGKTTCTFNIAGVMAKDFKKKVLLIDGDPSSNLTQCCLLTRLNETGSLEFLNSQLAIEDLFFSPDLINDAIQNVTFALTQNGLPKKRGMDIIPTRNMSIHPKRRLKNTSDALATGALEEMQIKKSLALLKQTKNHRYKYDYCLIDFEGGSEPDEKTAELLAACDYVLIPSTIDIFSANQTASVMTYINNVKKAKDTDIKIAGVFATSTSKSSVFDEDMLASYKEIIGNTFISNVSIRRSQEAAWSTGSGIPLAFNRKAHPLTNDFRLLTEEIIKRTGV